MTAQAWQRHSRSTGDLVRLVGLGVAALGLLVVGIVTAAAHGDNPISPGGSSGVAEVPLAVPTPHPADAEDLQPPAGFRAVDPSTPGTPAPVLADVLADDGDGTGVTQTVLSDLGFQRLRTRVWRSASDELQLVTYEFRDPQAARAFSDLAIAAAGGGIAPRAVPLPGSGPVQVLQLRAGRPPTQVAFLDHGVEAYAIALVGPSAAPGEPLLQDLLRGLPRPVADSSPVPGSGGGPAERGAGGHSAR